MWVVVGGGVAVVVAVGAARIAAARSSVAATGGMLSADFEVGLGGLVLGSQAAQIGRFEGVAGEPGK